MKRTAALGLALALVALGYGAWRVLGVDRPTRARQGSLATPASQNPSSNLGPVAPVEEQAQRTMAHSAQGPPRVHTPIQRVELGTSVERGWHGLALDGETDRPLSNASHAVLRSDPFDGEVSEQFHPARPDGRFEAEVASGRMAVVAVRCLGYAPAYVIPDGLVPSSSDPRRVRLWREASLDVRLEGGNGDVRAWTKHWNLIQGGGSTWLGWEDATWRAVPGSSGAYELTGLPPKAELTVDVTFSGRLRRTKLALEPGERRELVFRLGGGAIEGRAVDPDGRGLAELEVWLLGGDDVGRYLEPYMDDERLAQTKTAADGSFSFAELGPGDYFVGPSPRVPFVESHRGIAPVATRVTIGPEEGVIHVTLTCWRGLEIRGRVVDPTGQSVAEGHVLAYWDDFYCGEDIAPGGTFVLGPLVPGEYWIQALGSGGDGSSEPVMASGGQEGLELRLRAGGSVSAVLRDAVGRPVTGVDVRMLCTNDEDWEGWQMQATDESGTATFDGVLPGSYTVVAATSEHMALREDVLVAAGEARGSVELVLELAARLTIRAQGLGPEHGYRLRRNDCVLDSGALSNAPLELLVPPGDVLVEHLRWGEAGMEVVEERRVRVAAGERGTISFDGLFGEGR